MKSNNVFFTADLHFFHYNIIRYCNRPFSSLEEMHRILIANWNAKVSKWDRIYILGDFAWGSAEETKVIIKRLNGIKEFIIGSHDKAVKRLVEERFIHSLGYLSVLKIDNQLLTLCHWSMRTWPSSHYNTFHLFGHSHGKLEGWGKSFDIGVDCWGFAPLSWEEVKQEMEKRPDNFNLVRR